MNIEISNEIFEDKKSRLTINYGDLNISLDHDAASIEELKISDQLPKILDEILHNLTKNLELKDKDIQNIFAALDLFISGLYETIQNSSDKTIENSSDKTIENSLDKTIENSLDKTIENSSDEQDGVAHSKSIKSDTSFIAAPPARTNKLRISSNEIENPNDNPEFHESLKTVRGNISINNLSKIVQFANKPDSVLLSKVSDTILHSGSQEDFVAQNNLYQAYELKSDPKERRIDDKMLKELKKKLASEELYFFESPKDGEEFLIKNNKDGFCLLQINDSAGSSAGSYISKYVEDDGVVKELLTSKVYIKEPDYRSNFSNSTLTNLTTSVLTKLQKNKTTTIHEINIQEFAQSENSSKEGDGLKKSKKQNFAKELPKESAQSENSSKEGDGLKKSKKRNFVRGLLKKTVTAIDENTLQNGEVIGTTLKIYTQGQTDLKNSLMTLGGSIKTLKQYLRFTYNPPEQTPTPNDNPPEQTPTPNAKYYTLAVPISNNNSIIIKKYKDNSSTQDVLSFQAKDSQNLDIPITEEMFTDFIARLTIQNKNSDAKLQEIESKNVKISQAMRMVLVDKIYQHLMPQGDDDIASGILEINGTVYYATRSASYSKNPTLQSKGATKFLELRDIGGKAEFASRGTGYQGVEDIGERETLKQIIEKIIKEIEEQRGNGLEKKIQDEIEDFEKEILLKILLIEYEILEIKKANKILELTELEKEILELEKAKIEEKEILLKLGEAKSKKLQLEEEIEPIEKEIEPIEKAIKDIEENAQNKKPVKTSIEELIKILEKANKVEKEIKEVGITKISQLRIMQPRLKLPPVPTKGLMSNWVLGMMTLGNNDVNSRNLSVIQQLYQGGRMFNFINIDKKAGIGMFLSDPNSDFFLPFDHSPFRIFSDNKNINFNDENYIPLVGIINPQNPRHPYQFQKSIIFEKSNILELFETIYRLEKISDEMDINKINEKDKFTATIAELFKSYLPEDKSAIFYKRFIERKQELVASAKQYLKDIPFIDNDLLLKSSLLMQGNEELNDKKISSLEKPVLEQKKFRPDFKTGLTPELWSYDLNKPSSLSYEEYSNTRKNKSTSITAEILKKQKVILGPCYKSINAILSDKFYSNLIIKKYPIIEEQARIKEQARNSLENIFIYVSSMSKSKANKIKNVSKIEHHIREKLKTFENIEEGNDYFLSLSNKHSKLKTLYSQTKQVSSFYNKIILNKGKIDRDLEILGKDTPNKESISLSLPDRKMSNDLSLPDKQKTILGLLKRLNKQHDRLPRYESIKDAANILVNKISQDKKLPISELKKESIYSMNSKVNDCFKELKTQTTSCTRILATNYHNSDILKTALTEFAQESIINNEFKEALLQSSLEFQQILNNVAQNNGPSNSPNNRGATNLRNDGGLERS